MTSRPVDGARRRYLCRFIAANRSRGHGAYPAAAMRILIFHGYLLGGTGSNVYNAALAEALARLGHEVHLLSQDRDPLAHPWVDAAGDWDGGALSITTRDEPARVTAYRPDIAGLLPLYVADRYDGIEARPFPDLDDAELDRYVERNVAAVREVAERVRPGDPREGARRRAVRDQDPRQRPGVHRQAAPGALHAVREGGPRGRARGAR